MKRKPAHIIIAATLGLGGAIPVAMALDAVDKVAVCAGCHGPGGHSTVPDNPILAAQHADYLSTALQAYVDGERDNGIMKTMAERLNAQDVKDITAYYAAQPAHQSEAQARGDAARGAAKTATCAACHGINGHSVNPLFPNLAGQHALYLSNALRAYKSGARSSSIMLTMMTAALSDQDIEDIAAYYAAQPVQPPKVQAKENAQ